MPPEHNLLFDKPEAEEGNMFNGKLISVFQARPKDVARQWSATVPASLEEIAALELLRTRPDDAYATFAPTAPMELPRN